LFQLKKKIEKNTRTFLVHKNSEIKKILRDSDFQVVATYPQFFWPMGVHRFLKSKEKSTQLESFASYVGLVRIFGSPTILVAKKIN
jgi:hypothetical protein